MHDKEPRRRAEEGPGGPSGRRPYRKPGFVTQVVFERQALSCSGCALNEAGPPPFGCCLKS